MTCENCGHEYDPIRHRWLCPFCRWKASCCEGEPLPAERAERAGITVPVDQRWRIELADCVRCDDPICRFPDGAWQHFLDSRDDLDHDPEPDIESLTERQAEEQLQPWRVDVPRYAPVTLMEAQTEAAPERNVKDVLMRGGLL